MTNIEKLVKQVFQKLLPKELVYYNYRPDWLKNPKTGFNLELDIYYPNLNFAIEANGFTHKKIEDQIERDKIKNQICIDKSIYLLSISKLKLLQKQLFLNEIGLKINKKLDRNKLNYSLIQELINYKPKSNYWGSWLVQKYRYKKATEIQRKETESNRIRQEFKNKLKTKLPS